MAYNGESPWGASRNDANFRKRWPIAAFYQQTRTILGGGVEILSSDFSSESENAFGYDVLLDLIGAAINALGTGAEIG